MPLSTGAYLVLFCLIFCSLNTDAQKPKDLDTYTKQELELLPQLRSRVKDGLTQQYMFQNKYLVRFLRTAQWNLDAAENLLRENFRWRKQHRVDNLIFDFERGGSKFARRFPFHFISARDQRPTIVSAIKDLNVRQLVLTGEVAEMRRYIIYGIERAVWNVHLESNRTGMEIIEGNLLFNMAGFNVRTQACVACLPLWIELIDSYEKYYPQLGKHIIAINIPRVFHRFFTLIKPLATGHTLQALEMYSVDKTEWEPRILKLYSKDKLPLEFGGTAPPQQGPHRLSPEDMTIQLGPKFQKKIPQEAVF